MNTARMAGFSIKKPISELILKEVKLLVGYGELSPEGAKELLAENKKAKKIWQPFIQGVECSSSLW